MSVLVTGGAGYIGSHVVRLLQLQDADVVVVDDLSSGDAERIGDASLIELDLSSDGAQGTLEMVLEERNVEAVIHFAAQKQVGVSMERPMFYYRQNVGGMVNLLAAMETSGVQRLVFSSSAAVYGMPDVAMVTENTQCSPINPYGETKLIGEWMVSRAAAAWGLRAASLRYFNVAGAGWDDLGDPTAFNLVPIVFSALADGEAPKVFGADYPTPDGTCIRDYVHVLDLAEAHVSALEFTTDKAAGHGVFNIGTGTGSSVLEVITSVETATGQDITTEIVARRAGDPAQLVADVSRAQKVLGWTAHHGLDETVDSAWKAFGANR